MRANKRTDVDGGGLEIAENLFWSAVVIVVGTVFFYMLMAAAADEAAAGSTYFVLDAPDHVAVYVVCQEQGASGPPVVPTDAQRKSDGDVIYAYEDMKCSLIVKAPKPIHGLPAAIHGLREAVGITE